MHVLFDPALIIRLPNPYGPVRGYRPWHGPAHEVRNLNNALAPTRAIYTQGQLEWTLSGQLP